jgi:hypothetical protein
MFPPDGGGSLGASPVADGDRGGGITADETVVMKWKSYFVLNRYTVVDANTCPGFSTVLGNVGWFGESG